MTSDKRRRRKDEKLEKRRTDYRIAEGLRSGGVALPRGAIIADKSKHAPTGSYDPPPDYYVDLDFTCKDCGKKEVWTASQQKWYYEVAKGSLQATAVRCRACRRKHRNRPRGQGDPNPIKHFGSVAKRFRRDVEPALLDAGFEFGGKSEINARGRGFILEYVRSQTALHFSMGDAVLRAEFIDEHSEVHCIAGATLHIRSESKIVEVFDRFNASVRDYVLQMFPPSSG